MAQKLSDAIHDFSQKFARFSNQTGASRSPMLDKDDLTQIQINEREDRMKSAVLGTYRIYKSPYEALGKNSNRAKIIDDDEQNLLKAYNLYKAVVAVNAEKADDHTFLKDMEISSPLTEKYTYTSGGQFVYLVCWLRYEKNEREFIPEFIETEDGKYALKFFQSEKYEFDQKMKEVIAIIEANFYEGE